MQTLEELRKLETNKLTEELSTLLKELFKVKFEVRSGQAKNNHEIKNYKKQIARIKTVIREKEEITS